MGKHSAEQPDEQYLASPMDGGDGNYAGPLFRALHLKRMSETALNTDRVAISAKA
jgi:hypothetical protein